MTQATPATADSHQTRIEGVDHIGPAGGRLESRPSAQETLTRELVQLGQCLDQLEPLARELAVEPEASSTNWHRSLFQHLLPRLEGLPQLVVAVVGGTNTGKSMVFNQLAGALVSRVTHRACKTRHPVCLVPDRFLQNHDGHALRSVFSQFALRPWQTEDDALDESGESLLFVREAARGTLSRRLILLDTPDIDGCLQAHWDRAAGIRQAADVLVGVLTGQKYNDAAVTRFFREAAQADKAVMVVFNMVDWPGHAAWCDTWLEEFREATGVEPLGVYAVPRDEELGRRVELPFHALSAGGSDLRQDLAQLQFEAIKLRTYRGALRQVLSDQDGLPRHLAQIQSRSAAYAHACDAVRADAELCIQLPQIPSHLVTDEIWTWLEPRRTRLDRLVHGAYSWVGRGVMRVCGRRRATEIESAYREQEQELFERAVQQAIRRLVDRQRGGNEILRKELADVVSGEGRRQLFEEACQRYRELPLATSEYREFVRGELERFAEEHAWTVRSIRAWLLGTAVLRPVLTVALFGAPQLAQDVAGQAAATAAVQAAQEAAAQAAVHSTAQMVGEVAVGTATAVGGELAVAGSGAGLQALITRLFQGLQQRRTAALAQILDQTLLGARRERLQRLADVEHSPPASAARRLVRSLQQQYDRVKGSEP